MLFQGQGDWAPRLTEIHNNKSTRVMHKSSVGESDVSYWFAFISIKDIAMNSVTLKPKMVWAIGSFMEMGIGVKTEHTIK